MADGPRVLLFGTEFPPSPAGTAVYARSLALGLHGQGADVAVVTQAPKAGAASHDLPVPVSRVPFTGNVPRRYARHVEALRRGLEDVRPDLLWTTNGMGTRVAGLLPRLPCPLISCARGSDIRTRLPGRGILRRWEGRWQRAAYRRSAAVAAASRELRDYAAAQGVDAARLFVSHSAFDLSRVDSLPRDTHDDARPTLLTVARLTAQKRVDRLLRAVARVAEPAPHLVVVGDGPERGHLEQLARELGIDARVRFTGMLEPFSEALYREYREADLFALVSVGEGLANVLIEAGAFALPSVGVASGGTPEIVRHGDTGLLAQPDDVDDIAAQLTALLGDSGLRRRFGAAARTLVEEEYGIEALGRRSLAVVRAVLAGEPLPAEVDPGGGLS